MTGRRFWPRLDATAPHADLPASWWLPEPISIATWPQPHRVGPPAGPLGSADRPNPPRRAGSSRGQLASAAAVPGTATRTDGDLRWLIPAVVFVVLCLAVKWWSDRR